MKTNFFIAFIIFMTFSCENDKLKGIEDVLGSWSGEGASLTVELVGDDAWVTHIKIEKKYSSYLAYGVDLCIIEDYKFNYFGISGEFLSNKELELKENGNTYTLHKR